MGSQVSKSRSPLEIRRPARLLLYWAAVAVCLGLVFAVHGTALASANIYSSQRISSDFSPEFYTQQFSQPVVAGDRVSWVREMTYYAGGSVNNLYTWTPATGEVQLATGVTATWVRGSGDRLAWSERVNDSYVIRTWTPASGTVDVAPGIYPFVSGDRIAWVAGNKITTWTPAGGVVDVDPAATSGMAQIYTLFVSTDRIVWCTTQISQGTDYEVFMWTPAGGVQQLTNDTVDQSGVAVSGDRIAWGGSDGFYLWTPATGAVHVTSTAWDTPLAMSGDRIVGESSVTTSGVTYENLWTWTPAGGKVQLDSVTGYYTSVDIDGNRVAWVDSSYTPRLWTWTPASGKIAATPVGNYFAFFSGGVGVSGDRLAWNLPVGDGERGMCTGLPLTVGAPTITSVSPAEGPVGGGDSVVIKGTNFYWVAGASAVAFGGTNATSYKVDSLTQITAVAPAHGAGPVQVQVTAVGGTTADTAADDYHYVGPPTISSITPAVASSAGGTSVVVTGTGFENLSGAAGVKFGNTNAASYTVNSLTQITAITPAHVPGMVRVTVTTSGGESADKSADDFTYTPTFGPSEQFPPVRVTSNSYDDEMPEVSGDRIVWAAIADGTDYEVFTWTPSTGVVRLTTNSRDDQYPVVSGDRIAWVETGGSDGGADDEVFTWTPAGGVVQLTQNNLEDGWVNISGDRIVWMEAQTTTGENAEIFSWTPAGTQRITNNSYEDLFPEVSGNRIAWVNDSTPNWKALTWTPAGGTAEVYSGDRSIDYATVSGDRIACVSAPDRIYVWTPSGGSWVDAGNIGFDLRIDGERIAWDAEVRGVNQVFSWTPAEGTTQLSNGAADQFLERVSGDRVVWLDYGTADSEVYCWTPDRGAVQVTSDTVEQWAPVVSGNRLVWMGENATGTMELYTTVAGLPLTRVEETDPHILFSPSTSWLSFSSASASASAYKRANTGGSFATVYFDGTRLDWIAMKGTSTGKADVYLDDEFKTTIDLSAGVATYQVNVWSTGTIGAGVHKFSIVWNTGNVAGKFITLDRVEVAGHLVYAPPAITNLSPKTGSTAGGDSVVITGSGFTSLVGPSAVTFGGVNATSYTVNSATQITAAAPPHPPGPVSVRVVSDSMTSKDTAADDFTYAVPGVPTITSISPTSGPIAGGTQVTINGTDFSALSGPNPVMFGDTPATTYTLNSSVKITATAPAHAVGAVRVQVTTAAGTTPDTPADDFTYTVAPPTIKVDVIKTSTTTTPGAYFSGTWASYTSTSAYSGAYMRASTAGAYVILAFQGTKLDWITMKGTTGAVADIYVDGSPTKAATINLKVSSAVYQQNLWTTGNLPNGYHTVKIVRATTSPAGSYVTIDAVNVAGNLLAPLRKEENASPSPFTFSPAIGSWTLGSSASASGGTYRSINTAGAYVSFSFTGVGFQLIARTAPNYGNVTVTVDGVSQTVSLYSSLATYKKIVFTKFVAPGIHTVKLSRAGTKSTSSSGYTIDLDAIDLYGVPG